MTPKGQAGRELDALVAERVMGYVWKDESPSGRFLNSPEGWPAGYVPQGSSEMTWTSHLPHYSTDIAAAWLVVERLMNVDADDASHRYCLDFRADREPWGSDAPFVVEIRTQNAKRLAYVSADTMPLAICRAALAALGAP